MPGPQLRMSMTDFSNVPAVQMPPGYQLRTYRPGDEQAWADIMNRAGMGSWNVEKARAELFASPRFVPQGCFLATCHEVPVSAATAFLEDPPNNEVGQLHMVATRPEHRGRGLARQCSLAVVHFFSGRGFREVYLLTDDFRLAALKMYLTMGFQPSYYQGAGEERWAPIRRSLGL